jgi:uncharacterized protein
MISVKRRKSIIADNVKNSVNAKLQKLKAILRSYPGVVVAFSGGADSSLLLCVAQRVLGGKVVAVTASSPLYPVSETVLARRIARELGARHLIYRSREMDMPQFRKNPRNRCYYCKWELFAFMKKIADQLGYKVVEGGNRSDLDDFRPGRIAARKLGVRSPLAGAGLNKFEIRKLARRFKLPNWDKPAMACLASRIPYGRTVDVKTLSRIGQAESYLKRLKLTQLRVRDHLPIARIEVPLPDFARILRRRMPIVNYFKRLGYKYITLDLVGYQTGSMNL